MSNNKTPNIYVLGDIVTRGSIDAMILFPALSQRNYAFRNLILNSPQFRLWCKIVHFFKIAYLF